MKNRREFVKQVIAGLVFVGASLKDLFTTSEIPDCAFTPNSPDVRNEANTMPLSYLGEYPAGPSRVQENLHFDPTLDYINVAGMWFHIVVLASDNETHLYIDGKLVKTVAKEYDSELANKLIGEYFLNANSVSRTS